MKKFKFTLQAAYNVKESDEKNTKLQLKNVDKRIEAIQAEQLALDEQVKAEQEKLAELLTTGAAPYELNNYSLYFTSSRDKKQDLVRQLQIIISQREQLKNKLIRIKNELNVLDNKRDEQWKEYMNQVRIAEQKEIDAILSFDVAKAVSASNQEIPTTL